MADKEIARKEQESLLSNVMSRWPIGCMLTVEHDGFSGKVIGYYVTNEGKPGLVLQQFNTRVVHVYGEKWFEKQARF